MATSSGKKKPAPQTAEMKAARASIRQATLLGVEQQQQRVSSVSRGAFSSRRLRAGGASALAGYEIGGYKSDPFPKPTGSYVPSPGLPSPPQPRRSPPKPKVWTKPPTKPKTKPKAPTKKRVPPPPNPGGHRMRPE